MRQFVNVTLNTPTGDWASEDGPKSITWLDYAHPMQFIFNNKFT